MSKYRALTGLNYVSNSTGKEVRVEAGDAIEDLNTVASRNELAAGNIELWDDAPATDEGGEE